MWYCQVCGKPLLPARDRNVLRRFAGLQGNVNYLERHLASIRNEARNWRLPMGRRTQAAALEISVQKMLRANVLALNKLRPKRNRIREYELSRMGQLCDCAIPEPIEQPHAVDISVG
jgi:hypothetical protein